MGLGGPDMEEDRFEGTEDGSRGGRSGRGGGRERRKKRRGWEGEGQ